MDTVRNVSVSENVSKANLEQGRMETASIEMQKARKRPRRGKERKTNGIQVMYFVRWRENGGLNRNVAKTSQDDVEVVLGYVCELEVIVV